VLKRCRATLTRLQAPDYTDVSIELLGAESQFGALRHSDPSREVVAKIAVRHSDSRAVALFLKEATGLGLATPPGLSGFAGARPKPSPVMALFSYVTPKDQVQVRLRDDVGELDYAPAIGQLTVAADSVQPPNTPPAPRTVEVPLIELAWARSGDKGDIANIGVMARAPELMPWIWAAMTSEHLLRVFGHFLEGDVADRIERFYLPGSAAMNILLHGALGGGGTSSLRNDPQAKGYAQLLLAAPVAVDADLLALLRGENDVSH
ncbi:MAG: terpene utilization protein AtuA, partial [Roseobacter sp. MedPE-SW]